MKKKIILSIISLLAVAGFTACSKLDVIGDKSVESFEAVLSSQDSEVSEDTEFGGWSLTAPDGEARFLWSKDFSKTASKDVILEIDAQPFLDAGLNPDRLPESMFQGDKIVVGTNLGDEAVSYSGEAAPIASYQKIVDLYRDNITYHMALDHFGVNLMDGNMFEWAKDMATNDKDIVFVLNPQPFIDAGVDVASVDGWVYAKVETMDDAGKNIEVDKLLKPFDLESSGM